MVEGIVGKEVKKFVFVLVCLRLIWIKVTV